ncbi:MAG: ribokinase [Clostridia bacterium]|nr:ribokinase [Clostridia bacterium]
MKTLVFGSLNIDHVYHLPHVLRPGETLPSLSYQRNSGGKGLNQAIALARAGQEVWFAGGVGADGLFLSDALAAEGVDVRLVRQTQTPTGHAVIYVDAQGGNSIVLYGGANQCVTREMIGQVLEKCSPGDLVLLQNEVNLVPDMIRAARAKGLRVALNPSPAAPEMRDWPLEMVDWLLLNEVEGHDLTGCTDPDDILDTLLSRYPACRVVLTLGSDGAAYADAGQRMRQAAMQVEAVDTTAAGDTFTGYFLHTILSGGTAEQALLRATQASAIAVGRPGASASIPRADELP